MRCHSRESTFSVFRHDRAHCSIMNVDIGTPSERNFDKFHALRTDSTFLPSVTSIRYQKRKKPVRNT